MKFLPVTLLVPTSRFLGSPDLQYFSRLCRSSRLPDFIFSPDFPGYGFLPASRLPRPPGYIADVSPARLPIWTISRLPDYVTSPDSPGYGAFPDKSVGTETLEQPEQKISTEGLSVHGFDLQLLCSVVLTGCKPSSLLLLLSLNLAKFKRHAKDHT